MNTIRIESDGTALGTKAFYPNGEQIGGVCEVTFPPIGNFGEETVTLKCELASGSLPNSPNGPRLQLITNGSGGGTILIGAGDERIDARDIVIEKITRRSIPRATITFYVAKQDKPVKSIPGKSFQKSAYKSGWPLPVEEPKRVELPATRQKKKEQIYEMLSRHDVRIRSFDIAEELLDLMELEEPHLGAATTEQLIQELAARALVGGYAKHRTIDSD